MHSICDRMPLYWVLVKYLPKTICTRSWIVFGTDDLMPPYKRRGPKNYANMMVKYSKYVAIEAYSSNMTSKSD